MFELNGNVMEKASVLNVWTLKIAIGLMVSWTIKVQEDIANYEKEKKWINTRKVYTKAVEINRRTVLREWIQKTVENEKELMQHHHNPPFF